MKRHTPEWERAADREARSFCPDIYPCEKCEWPVVRGYCCGHCGDANPSESRAKGKAKR